MHNCSEVQEPAEPQQRGYNRGERMEGQPLAMTPRLLGCLEVAAQVGASLQTVFAFPGAAVVQATLLGGRV